MNLQSRVCCCGACEDSDCNESINFSITQPAVDLDISSSWPNSTSLTGLGMPENTTNGYANCVTACDLDYRFDDCATSGTDCELRNYYLTPVCIMKRTTNTGACNTGPPANLDYEMEFDLGTHNCTTVGEGTCVETVGSGKSAYTKTYVPAMNNFWWVPQVTAINYSPGGATGEWEYTITFWACTPTTGMIVNDTAGLIDDCDRTGQAAHQEISNIAGQFFYRTGDWTVRKTDGTCLQASWNGTTQTASGSGVVSITPPTSSAGGGLMIPYPFRITAGTGSGSSYVYDACDTNGYETNRYFKLDTADSFFTSFGGTLTWSLT